MDYGNGQEQDAKFVNIGFDLDGVLVDFSSAWLDAANRILGTNHTVDDIITWSWPIDDPKRRKIFMKLIRDGDFMCSLPVFPGAKELISRVSASGNKVYVITGREKRISEETFKFVRREFPEVSNIWVTHHSNKFVYAKILGIRVFVEDSLKTAISMARNLIHTYLMDYPWNHNRLALFSANSHLITMVPRGDMNTLAQYLERDYPKLFNRDS